MTPLEYCRNKVALPGSTPYYLIRFAPPHARDALLAVFAYYTEVMEVPLEVSDPGVGQVKLQWWREELQRAADGNARHPVGQALEPALQAHGLETEHFAEIIEGAAMDLEYGRYPSFRELTVYCHRTGGSLTHLAAAIGGYRNPKTAHFAHDLGMAVRLFEVLADVRRHAAAGRLHIPEDELRAAGVDAAAFLQADTSPALRSLFREQAQRITAFLDQAEAHLPDEDRDAQRSGMIHAALTRAMLDEMAKDDYPLVGYRFDLTPLRKAWIAWRTTRRQQRITRKAAS